MAKEHKTRPKQFDPSLYKPKPDSARATGPQLWRLNRHPGYIRRALEQSGGEYIKANVAHELIVHLMSEGLPEEAPHIKGVQ